MFGSTRKKLLTKPISKNTFRVSHLRYIRNITLPHHPIILIKREPIFLIVMIINLSFRISALTQITRIIDTWYTTELIGLNYQNWLVSHLFLWHDHWWVGCGVYLLLICGVNYLAALVYAESLFWLVGWNAGFKEFCWCLLWLLFACAGLFKLLPWWRVAIELVHLGPLILFVALAATDWVVAWG